MMTEVKPVEILLKNKPEKLSDFSEPLNLMVNDFLKKLDLSLNQFKKFRILTSIEKKALLTINKQLSKVEPELLDLSNFLFEISNCEDEYDLDFLLTSFEAKV